MKFSPRIASTPKPSATKQLSLCLLLDASRFSHAWTPGLIRQRYAGLSEGDAHVIRNAGGRASDDAIRSLVISYKLLGTKEWFVIHHTDCGMALFTDTIIRGLLKRSLETAQVSDEGWKDVGQGLGSDEGDFINWLAFTDETSSVITDVTRIRNHPLVPRSIPVYGYVYDVRSGNVIDVPAATKAGAPQV